MNLKELIMNKFFAENPNLMPKRSTVASAGYDFIAPKDYIVPAHGTCLIESEVAVELDSDKVLLLFIRSSYGFKYGVTLANGTGIIDSDFYPNTIKCKLKNDSDTDLLIKAGEHYMQGIITNFITVDNETPPEQERNGGIGSTGK